MKILTTVIAAGICAACLGGNILKNPGFETVDENRKAAVWGRETVEENGSNALKLKAKAQNGSFENQVDQVIEKVSGGNYILTGKLKGNLVQAVVVCRFYPPEGGKGFPRLIVIPKDRMQNAGKGWLSFTGKIKGPVDAESYKLHFFLLVRMEKQGDELLIDDLSLSPEQTAEKGK